MEKRHGPLTLAAFFLVVLTAAGVPAARGAGGRCPPDPVKALYGMEAAYGKVDDYTANFLKRERVNGELLPQESIFLRFKKPFMVYMKWLKGPHEGREALYVRGKNDGKVIGHEGGFFSFVTLRMDPNGRTAMRGNRHPITDVGIGRLIGIVMENVRHAGRAGELRAAYAGEQAVFGKDACRIVVNLPPDKDKGYYCKKFDIWVDEGLGLPIKITIYGWRGEVLESYIYKDFKLNPGLKAAEFDRGYKDYGF